MLAGGLQAAHEQRQRRSGGGEHHHVVRQQQLRDANRAGGAVTGLVQPSEPCCRQRVLKLHPELEAAGCRLRLGSLEGVAHRVIKIDREERAGQGVALLGAASGGEGRAQLAAHAHTAARAGVQVAQHGDQLLRQAAVPENGPQAVAVDAVEGLAQVNEA